MSIPQDCIWKKKRAINRLMNKAAAWLIGDVELVIFVVGKAPVGRRTTKWS
ncbi:hypothetical protein KCP78_12650 [Salmonella enterica subsp. enterica]|nr:hypothetical protein KCP78_12650 [Salmonella enterica subsp. enterica]